MREPARNTDLHGSAPDTSPVALLLIDVINDLEFEGGDRLLEAWLPAVERLAALRDRARSLRVPVIYVNDNYGRWQSDLAAIVEHCTRAEARGRAAVERLRPAPEDYFVLKPKLSGFFSTTLDTLLTHLGAETLILTGVSSEVCVLFTAGDAYMRDYRLVVPDDCVASVDPESAGHALEQMRRLFGAETTPSAELDLRGMMRGSGR